MRSLLFFLAALGAATVAQAEQYEVWEDSGWIWGRDNQVAEEWTLSRWATGSQPAFDGYTAVWIDSRHYGTDILGYSFKAAEIYGRNDAEFPMVISDVYRSDPHISYMEDAATPVADGTYWVAWRQGGGVWAVYWAMDSTRKPLEILPDYTGPFSMDLDVLTYEGGTVQLEDPGYPLPEPGTLWLLATAVVVGLLVVRRRY